jgi:hypothetical protein
MNREMSIMKEMKDTKGNDFTRYYEGIYARN